MPQTLGQQILAQKAGPEEVLPGQIVTVAHDLLLNHDDKVAISRKFRQLGVKRI